MFGLSTNRFSDWLWSMNGAAVGRHVDQRAHRHLPRGAVDRAQVRRAARRAPCTEPSAILSRVAHRLGPQAERLQLVDQVAVDLEEVARQRLALEQVRDLRLDALVAAGDRGDGRGRRDGDQQRVAQPVLARSARAAPPSRSVRSGVDAPGVELQLAARGARLGERRVRALLRGQLGRGRQRVEVDLLGDPLRERARLGRSRTAAAAGRRRPAGPSAQADRAPAQVRAPRPAAIG